MKEKEEDEENKIRKFACRQTDNQVNKQSLIQKLRPPYPLWSVDRQGAGQQRRQ